MWLDGAKVARHTPIELQRELGLRHTFEELASAFPVTQAYCVLDGLGAVSSEQGWRNVGALIRALRVGYSSSPWKVLISCQQEEWNRVYQETARAASNLNLNWSSLTVSSLQVADLQAVWQAFPQLQSLRDRRDIHPIVLRPKVLDLIASKVKLGAVVDADRWVGESDVALWYWDNEVAKPPAPVVRSLAARAVAERQADELTTGIGIGGLPEGTDALIADNVLLYSNGVVSFQHDLFGDWSRLQLLIEQKNAANSFVESKLISSTLR